ncbi:hypothetical protein QE152_g36790 [Popillia japonica]|uniref:Uncharacterized protein n=1 Tax=Popillia japonica TaxID=7064 RepID=A0AAW1ICJ0_POPJA
MMLMAATFKSHSFHYSQSDLQIALIPLQPDELTDTENFDENNLQREEVQDVAGTLELFISNICDESELNSDDEPLAMKKRRISKMKENRKASEYDKKNNSIFGKT